MSNKKNYYHNKSFVKENAELEEQAPIVEAPTAIEETLTQESSIVKETKEESKPSTKKNKKRKEYKVILIAKNGCIAEDIDKPGQNKYFFGSEYRNKKIGENIEE